MFLPVVRCCCFMLRQGPDFHFEISGYWRSEVEITRFNCISIQSRLLFRREAKPFKASVAQLDAPSDWRPGGRRFNRGRQHSFVKIDYEIFSTVILSLPLVQEGQLSVSGERMCTILVNRLEG